MHINIWFNFHSDHFSESQICICIVLFNLSIWMLHRDLNCITPKLNSWISLSKPAPSLCFCVLVNGTTLHPLKLGTWSHSSDPPVRLILPSLCLTESASQICSLISGSTASALPRAPSASIKPLEWPVSLSACCQSIPVYFAVLLQHILLAENGMILKPYCAFNKTLNRISYPSHMLSLLPEMFFLSFC